jgi:hypothetical protein
VNATVASSLCLDSRGDLETESLKVGPWPLRLSSARGAPRALLTEYLVHEASVSASEVIAPTLEVQLIFGGERPSLDADRFLARTSEHSVVAMERAAPRGYVWYRHPDSLMSWERAQPLRPLLAWWAEAQGAALAHAAAVAGAGGAGLIVGPPAAGKSTLAAVCHAHGLHFLGDDYVLVDAGTNTVFSLYRSLKITPSAALALNPTALSSELRDEKRDRLILKLPAPRTDAQLTCVIVPRVVDGPSRLGSISRARALAGVGPSTLLQSPGVTRATFEVLAQVVRSLPCYELEFGSDWAQTARLIRELLA